MKHLKTYEQNKNYKNFIIIEYVYNNMNIIHLIKNINEYKTGLFAKIILTYKNNKKSDDKYQSKIFNYSNLKDITLYQTDNYKEAIEQLNTIMKSKEYNL